MSAKPLHRGHWHLITTASKECDEVHVYTSLTDRDNVLGAVMMTIWQFEVKLPQNVTVHLNTESPVRRVWERLGQADKSEMIDEYVLYGDPLDLQGAFSEGSLRKYLPRLMSNNLVTLRPIDRDETGGISGTQMREWLKDGDKVNFIKNLPEVLDGDRIWNMFKQ
jgi:ATP sulfurylase